VIRQRETARNALVECARSSDISDVGDWQQSESGAPLQRADGHHWSISHTRWWAAAVVADQPVGIDLECIRPRREEFFDEVGTRDDWSIVGEKHWDNFFMLWTAKEATLKANGQGIGRFHHCRVLESIDSASMILMYEERQWRVLFHRFADHLAAVTADEGVDVLWNVADSKQEY
jgi:phosphopantetheinyl transferase